MPRARVVKAFNTTPQEIYEHAPETLRAYGVTCFVCGDDAGAKAAVMGLAEELGLEPLDCGPLRRARLIEGLADFVRYAIGGLGLGFQTALSVGSLPETRSERLGGRREPASR